MISSFCRGFWCLIKRGVLSFNPLKANKQLFLPFKHRLITISQCGADMMDLYSVSVWKVQVSTNFLQVRVTSLISGEEPELI